MGLTQSRVERPLWGESTVRKLPRFRHATPLNSKDRWKADLGASPSRLRDYAGSANSGRRQAPKRNHSKPSAAVAALPSG